MRERERKREKERERERERERQRETERDRERERERVKTSLPRGCSTESGDNPEHVAASDEERREGAKAAGHYLLEGDPGHCVASMWQGRERGREGEREGEGAFFVALVPSKTGSLSLRCTHAHWVSCFGKGGGT